MGDSEALPFVERSLPAIRACLREGTVSDAEFDQIYPHAVRAVSRTFWSPVRVAARAAALLVDNGATHILDVGAGAGKFCLVGALATGARFTGVEHREHFVRAARVASDMLKVDGVEFVHGPMEALDIAEYDGVYMFNPFEENLWAPSDRLDEEVKLSFPRFFVDVALIEGLLAMAKPGTRVVTYHGFGGRIPKSYRQHVRERIHTGHLELWVKSSAR